MYSYWSPRASRQDIPYYFSFECHSNEPVGRITAKKRGEAPLLLLACQRAQVTLMRVRAVPITAPVRQCKNCTVTVQVPVVVGLMMQS